MSDETIDGIAHEQLTERRTTSGSDDVSERQICSVCCRQQPDAYGYDEYRSEDWPCPAVQKKRFQAAYGSAVAELSEQRQENARLRERVAVLTEALRTVAECRGDGAWYCKSDVAATALSQADDGGRS